jgi:hypothetical protein
MFNHLSKKKRCGKTDTFDPEKVAISCQKLVADFRFLLAAESLGLVQSSFEKHILSASERIHSPESVPMNKTIGNVTNESKFSPFVQYIPESMQKPLKLGTIMRMMFSQMEQKLEHLAPENRSEVFQQMFSRLVNNASSQN